MLPENKAKKVPDFAVTDLAGLTGVVECKRRLGLSKFEVDEAQHVAGLYEALRGSLREHGRNISIEVVFTVELQEVPKVDFVEKILKSALGRSYDEPVSTTRGSYVIRQLRYFKR